jgi:5-methylcytosine-specific restriction enzyme subunit McrC
MRPSRRPVPIVTAREFGAVSLPRPFNTTRVRERLENAGRRAGLRTFETRDSSLYALGIVGVIDIGNLIVEILPKVGDADSLSDGAAFLGELLRFVGRSRQPTTSGAAISADGGGLFELLLGWAVDEAARHLAGGLPRRYVPIEELSSAVRGRIDMRHLALQRPGRAFELRVRHSPLSENNLIAQTVRWLLGEIALRTQSHRTRSRALNLYHSMALVDPVAPTQQALARLTLSPLETHWQPLIVLAQTLLKQGTPDPARAGGLRSVAVLYSLHELFEEAVRQVLLQGLKPLGLKNAPLTLSLMENVDHSLIRLKPDFLFTAGRDGPNVVGDAKWKRIFRNNRVMLGEDDAYQLTSYLAATSADRAFLISPLDVAVPPLCHRRYSVAGLNRPVTLIGIHLPTMIADCPNGEQVRANLCRLVAE